MVFSGSGTFCPKRVSRSRTSCRPASRRSPCSVGLDGFGRAFGPITKLVIWSCAVAACFGTVGTSGSLSGRSLVMASGVSLPSWMCGNDQRRGVERELDVVRQQRLHHRPVAAVGHVDHVDRGELDELRRR